MKLLEAEFGHRITFEGPTKDQIIKGIVNGWNERKNVSAIQSFLDRHCEKGVPVPHAKLERAKLVFETLRKL